MGKHVPTRQELWARLQGPGVTTREIGDIPGCRPPGSTPTLLEMLGFRVRTAEQIAQAWAKECANEYGRGRTRETHGRRG